MYRPRLPRGWQWRTPRCSVCRARWLPLAARGSAGRLGMLRWRACCAGLQLQHASVLGVSICTFVRWRACCAGLQLRGSRAPHGCFQFTRFTGTKVQILTHTAGAPARFGERACGVGYRARQLKAAYTSSLRPRTLVAEGRIH